MAVSRRTCREPLKEVNLFTRKRVVVITFLLILLWNGFFVSASCSLIIDGSIFKEDGLPIDGVNVFIWKDEMFLTQVETNLDGNFSLDVEPSFRYLIYIYADDEATPGLDYIPTSIETTPIDDETYRVVLEPAASLLFEGDIQFFESEKLPLATRFTIHDPNGEITLRYVNFSSEDPKTEVIESTLGVKLPDIVVLVNSNFVLGVNSSILVNSKIVNRYFEAREEQCFALNKGEQAVIDLQHYSVAYNLGILASSIEQVDARLIEMEEQGFYLVAERSTVSSAKKHLTETKYLYRSSSLKESFDTGKKGYIDTRLTIKKLEDMTVNAYISTFALITFLAVASTSFALILQNDAKMKLAVSLGAFLLAVFVLYQVYPGCVLVPTYSFILTGFIAIISCLITALTAPKMLRGHRVTGYIPIRMIIIPILSLAKRGIKRRRLRFLLTLTSITMLVLSFVMNCHK